MSAPHCNRSPTVASVTVEDEAGDGGCGRANSCKCVGRLMDSLPTMLAIALYLRAVACAPGVVTDLKATQSASCREAQVSSGHGVH